ncbi:MULTISPECIES: MarR family winged helix-turn-helix transcriptional regulator [unclassified Gordonia (in: high G+C Gram-positive bacteria)]|uniref:MarR family winged helix-turn-helix transcriptional regulator n=1 Tax=unclassified Gordonia (in: high G+C Gram-positive bacteria) TaxID=2657482 RepID=UPI0007E9CFE5|nr:MULTISPECIES: MarR family transcriptional regulator [unclassified Gordonia (in: high G+C Gram-positive bacteria)]OBC10848.1 MarR family transcriptional regulator [Gordonia sp. 852002-50395_SCH5434458]OBC20650.1 MarR family transcriptional regulator [Gordonia sp. 852002-50816_SCH5313054-a]OBC21120.1 MarR family transcriptional regulator [Gordonia sp. 852002-50816_SCH5313054-c]
MDTNPLLLERQVCFALAVANRSVLRIYRRLLDPLGLTHPQYLVMLALWESEPRAVKDIGAVLQLDSATLSPLLKRLEQQQLIVRRRRGDDERNVDVDLTSSGRALREQALSIPGAVVDALGVELSDLEELHRALTRVNTAAVAAAKAPSA